MLNIITVANSALALLSFAFSVYVFIKNKLYSKSGVETAILNSISQANADVAKSLENLSVFQDDSSDLGKTMKQNTIANFDSLLLAYDYACSKYYKKNIDTDWFEYTYTTQIDIIFDNPIYQDLLVNEKNYLYLRKFHSESHKQTKVKHLPICHRLSR